MEAAEVVWEFLHLGHKPIPADVIIAMGTNDLRVAEFAADLYEKGFGKRIVCTGGFAHQGDLLATSWPKTEAEMYADVLVGRGIPADRILLETQATNTAENVRFTRRLLEERGIRPNSVVFAVKRFMQRRTWATMAVEWPEMPGSLASPQTTLSEYFTDELTPERIINIMMGDLQRVWLYGKKGWSAPQRIPEAVKNAFAHLQAAGFTSHLLPEEA